MPWLRSIGFASGFVGTFLVWLPLSIATNDRNSLWTATEVWRTVAWVAIAVGGAISAWCIAVFAGIGRGTPAPFDPPRRLVVLGPYRWVRNPMYLGALLLLLGELILFGSRNLVLYIVTLMVASFAFVVLYEEPHLRRTFGSDYEQYCARVRRWLPRIPSADS